MFKTIPNYPNYMINEKGEVKSVYVKKLLKPRVTGRGYLTYQLRNDNGIKNEYVHRLVASTFIPNPYNLPQVDHINGNKTDNTVSNLRWIDRSSNMRAYGYEQRVRNSKDNVSVRIKACSDTQTLLFDSQTELLKYFGYKLPTSHLKFNEKYKYGKLKDFTLYRL